MHILVTSCVEIKIDPRTQCVLGTSPEYANPLTGECVILICSGYCSIEVMWDENCVIMEVIEFDHF